MHEPIIKSELRINNILFWLCFLITLIAIFMALLSFFSRGVYPPSQIGMFYVGILIIYALHKEAIRFLDKSKIKKGNKKGEFFVYLWIIITAGLYLIDFLTKNYYSISETGEKLNSIVQISFIALEVGAIFILARILKLIMIKIFQKNE
ncbi:hypothetical protein KKA23_02975 [Patescibacteria group bacterium]|nr:hypothetical protein [Patescibacteria group bacterium]